MPQRFKDRVAWVRETSRPFTATEFLIVLSYGLIHRADEWPGSEADGAACLLRWPLANSETLFLLRRAFDMSDASTWLGRELISTRLPLEWEAQKRGFDHRLHLIVEHEGNRGCWDLAYDV
jgi:hypothetical protein